MRNWFSAVGSDAAIACLICEEIAVSRTRFALLAAAMIREQEMRNYFGGDGCC